MTSQLYYYRGILYLQNNNIVLFLKRSPWFSKGSSRIQYNCKKTPSILFVTGVHLHHISGIENRKLRLSSFLILAAPHEKTQPKNLVRFWLQILFCLGEFWGVGYLFWVWSFYCYCQAFHEITQRLCRKLQISAQF